ncbi:MAG: TolC family protein, partial [Verrucomicrobiales bacterium]|nr:TolC family protein [Verrucomicrobiales bacterium]
MTLDQAVGHALSHNPDLVALRLGIDQARARANQAGRLASPELSSQVGPNIAGREIAVSVGFDQRFPALARLRAERAVSRAGLEEAAAEVDDAERRVVLRVRTSAVECLAASSQLELKERQIANGRELVETARRAAERGEAARIEAEQWELETRQLELERLPLEASRREALAELRSWLGLPRERDLELIGQLPDPLLPAEAPWEPSIRPDYRAARARGEAAEHGIAVARAGR